MVTQTVKRTVFYELSPYIDSMKIDLGWIRLIEKGIYKKIA